jgi:uncharacterized repeat protein (TIGR03803 family)
VISFAPKKDPWLGITAEYPVFAVLGGVRPATKVPVAVAVLATMRLAWVAHRRLAARAAPPPRNARRSKSLSRSKPRLFIDGNIPPVFYENRSYEEPKQRSQPMRARCTNPFLLITLIAGLGLIPAGRVTAQTFTALHNFTVGGDGAVPFAGLLLSGNALYGTAGNGGSSGVGTIFRVNTDGMDFTNLHNFTARSNNSTGVYTNSDGAGPSAGLLLSGNTLYGTARLGGSSGQGTVFRVNTNGTGFTNLHNFSAFSVGAGPQAGLILSSNTLYGTAMLGGSAGQGTVFRVNTDGTGFTNLHNFSAFANSFYTNSDGANPTCELILSGNMLYGTAAYGGSSSHGAVFRVNTDGTGFTTLHSFTGGSDGDGPRAGLILSGDTLYGTAMFGGSSGQGTVFRLNTDGASFTNLHDFTALSGPSPSTNSDGASPNAGLILSGDTLYGTAQYGGSSGIGTVFAVSTDAASFTALHSFAGYPSEGYLPEAGLVLLGNTLYGTTAYGGSSENGTVFSLSFAPQLAITPSEAGVVLTWPTNYAGFDYTGFTLQSAPDITGTFTNHPAATSPYTNPIASAQQFFRLTSN